MPTIRVLLFAAAREAAGNVPSVDVDLQEGSADTAVLSRSSLAEKYPKLAPLVSNEEYITLALNEEYVPKGSVLPLKAGDVVALIPPISGG
ncbi:ThiS family [Seminavis robusta]|uniref:ThiS family n=1 Tax=Seminavis robusta TaxID=568900 RepID=A0A9N8D9M5_9STRA|nr:ThiS family [Seminavis robusta]|eukprot:Sro54_g031710.1 ThiS family (91) ;mRNA; r:26364-26802